MKWRVVVNVVIATLVMSGLLGSPVLATNLDIDKEALKAQLTAEKVVIPFANDFEHWPEPTTTSGGANSTNTGDARGHIIDGVKVIYYKTMVWGNVEASFNDFRNKVAETLNDARGWTRAGLKFVEVNSGQDLDVILSDPAHLGATPGCSSELSCTT